MPNVKGSAISSRALWVSLQHGDPGLAKVKETVGSETKAILDSVVVKSRWYPFDAFVELNQAIDTCFGSGDLTVVRQLGRFGADANLTTVYRLFYMVGTVKWILDRAARLWDLHYDSGKLLVVRHPGNEVELRIVKFAAPHRTHCVSVMGWAERSVELSGGRDVNLVETACRAKGDEECSFHATWR